MASKEKIVIKISNKSFRELWYKALPLDKWVRTKGWKLVVNIGDYIIQNEEYTYEEDNDSTS